MKTEINAILRSSATGVYILILHVSKKITLTIGKLGEYQFPEGYYAYTGSALGLGALNLKNRITRHLKRRKCKFWHIDYLTENHNVSIEAIIVAETIKKIECPINKYLKNLKTARIPIKKFGASDCRTGCQSHLLYFPDLKNQNFLINKIVFYLELQNDILSIIVFD